MPDRRDVMPLFERAFGQLEIAVASPIAEARDLAGIVKSFEFVFELAWKAIQAVARGEGREVLSPRAAFVEAFKAGWTPDAVVWKEILDDRNRTVHTYDETFAREMCARIATTHIPAFETLLAKLKAHVALVGSLG